MDNYFPNIIRHSLDLLDELKNKSKIFGKKYPNLKDVIVKYLVTMISVMRENILIHLPLLHTYLIDDRIYREMIENLQKTGYFEV